jgi:hypothetical protein
MSERTDKDYAIEHATYMADAAKNYLAAINAEFVARMDAEEIGTPAMHDLLNECEQYTCEAYKTLESRIYEFEKRRDRALQGEPQ